jgi:hypothetical protein
MSLQRQTNALEAGPDDCPLYVAPVPQSTPPRRSDKDMGIVSPLEAFSSSMPQPELPATGSLLWTCGFPSFPSLPKRVLKAGVVSITAELICAA